MASALLFRKFGLPPVPCPPSTNHRKHRWTVTNQTESSSRCASCWQQFGVWVNEVLPESRTGFSAHSQTTVCAGIDRQSPKLAINGSISVIREVNLYQYVQNQLQSVCLPCRTGQPLEPALVSSAHHDSPSLLASRFFTTIHSASVAVLRGC